MCIPCTSYVKGSTQAKKTIPSKMTVLSLIRCDVEKSRVIVLIIPDYSSCSHADYETGGQT